MGGVGEGERERERNKGWYLGVWCQAMIGGEGVSVGSMWKNRRGPAVGFVMFRCACCDRTPEGTGNVLA